MAFLGHDGSISPSALWNRKSAIESAIAPRVLIASADVNVGESMVLLLGLKGYPSRLATNAVSVHTVLDQWTPQAIFLDSRIGGVAHLEVASRVSQRSDSSEVMLIAMSGGGSEEVEKQSRSAGYDGYLRRPCPIWQMADILNNFFT
jgi:DNA-binding response OmpR family regulator